MKWLVALATAVMLCITPASAKEKELSDAQILAKVARSMVKVSYPVDDENHSVCAGFSVDAPRGWILTVAHCVKQGDVIQEVTVNNQPSKLVKLDDNFALLQVEAQKYPPLAISEEIAKVGDRVLNFGYGLDNFTMLHRYVAFMWDGDIALDGPTIKGMSGGPIVDVAGRVVGINQSNAVVGFACGAGEIRTFLKVATNSGPSSPY